MTRMMIRPQRLQTITGYSCGRQTYINARGICIRLFCLHACRTVTFAHLIGRGAKIEQQQTFTFIYAFAISVIINSILRCRLTHRLPPEKVRQIKQYYVFQNNSTSTWRGLFFSPRFRGCFMLFGEAAPGNSVSRVNTFFLAPNNVRNCRRSD